jgi:hypothetical protein
MPDKQLNIPETDGEEGLSYEPEDENNNSIPDGAEQRANYDINRPALPSAPRKKFKNTFVGQSLRGKTKVGKAFYSLIGLGVTATTGYNAGPLMDLFLTTNQGPTMLEFLGDFNVLSFVFMLIAVALAYLKSRAGNMLDSVYEQARIGFNMMSDFKKKASDGGTTITEKEKDQIIEQAGRVFEAIIGVIKPHIFNRDSK